MKAGSHTLDGRKRMAARALLMAPVLPQARGATPRTVS